MYLQLKKVLILSKGKSIHVQSVVFVCGLYVLVFSDFYFWVDYEKNVCIRVLAHFGPPLKTNGVL